MTKYKCTDDLGNVAYIHQGGLRGNWTCTLANGTPAAFFYAVGNCDEMALRFSLRDAKNDAERLLILQSAAGKLHTITMIGPNGPDSLPGTPLASAEAWQTIAEAHRDDMRKDMVTQDDSRAEQLARAADAVALAIQAYNAIAATPDSAPDHDAIATDAGWTRHANGKDWVSPCGNFIESSALAACRIDNLV